MDEDGIGWYWMVLDGIGWYWMVFNVCPGLSWPTLVCPGLASQLVLFGLRWSRIVLDGLSPLILSTYGAQSTSHISHASYLCVSYLDHSGNLDFGQNRHF